MTAANLNPDDVEIAARALALSVVGYKCAPSDDTTRHARAVVAALAAAGRLREPAPADVQDVVDETVARWRDG